MSKRPFSNAVQYMYWMEMNCEHCAIFRNDEEHQCAIYSALEEAAWDDGTVPDLIWSYMGKDTGHCTWKVEP